MTEVNAEQPLSEPQSQSQPQPQPHQPDHAAQAVPQALPAVATRTQARNPLHGLTLERIVTELQAHYGWDGLAGQIPLRCFLQDPSVPSTLKLLRKTPWAREKVESLYLFMLREQRRNG